MANHDDKPQELPVEGAPPADAHCPNCNGPGIRKGKVIACQVCDAAFRYTREGPKLDELGPFDDHERRIAKLEGETNEGIAKRIEDITQSRQPAEPDEPQPPEPAKPEPAKPSADDGL